MSTQDDELKLDPPDPGSPRNRGDGVRISRGGDAPLPAPSPAPQPPVPARPDPPVARPAESELEPGRGRPMVEGPPMSVDEPIAEQSINRTAAIGGIGLLGVGLVVALVLLLVIVFAVCRH